MQRDLRLGIGEARRHYPENREATDARQSHPSPGLGEEKEWQEAERKHVALLTGASVGGVTATRL